MVANITKCTQFGFLGIFFILLTKISFSVNEKKGNKPISTNLLICAKELLPRIKKDSGKAVKYTNFDFSICTFF